MDMITVTARTLDEAITKASITLGTTSDNLDYTIIEKGSSGLFGVIGVKPVVISAKRKEKSEQEAEEPVVTVQEAIRVEKSKTSIESKKEKSDRSDMDFSNSQELAKTFLNNIFEVMEMKVTLETSFHEKDRELIINMSGDSMGVLIGKRGQTLDSLQYLVSLVVNKHYGDYIRVKLDTENYRERRKETLEVLAKNVAYKVKRTKRSISLEPMNPYERRVIHSALQNDKYIVTRSEGQEPFRHIVIALKRENKY